MTRFRKLSAAFMSMLLLLSFSTSVFAKDGVASGGSGSGSSGSSNTASSGTKEIEATKATETEVHKSTVVKPIEKSDDSKAKACDTRKNAVTTIEKRVANRGQARLDAITKIATKVENYVQASNLTVTNYDSLVASVNAKRVAAQSALDATKNAPAEVTPVTCQNGEGRAKVEGFKKDMTAQQAALKAYRQSVKTLITAVKAAKTNSGETQR